MNDNSEHEVVNFPGPLEASEDARQARVRSLKRRIAAGHSRLDARAVADAMVEQGLFSAGRPSTVPSISDQESLQRAIERFVVKGDIPQNTSDGDRRAA